MIDRISQKAAAYLAGRSRADREQEEVYAYGLNILLGESLQVLVVLLIAFCLNLFYYTVVVCITFAAFRLFGGGPHLSTRWSCLLVSTAEITGLSFLAAWPVPENILLALLLGSLSFILLAVYRWAPGGTSKKPLEDPLIRRRLKIKTLFATVVWLLVSLYLLTNNQTRYSLALLLGAADAMFWVTPIGYRLMSALDLQINWEGGGPRESI